MSHNPKDNIKKIVGKYEDMWGKPRNPSRIPILLSLLGEYWQRPGYNDLRLAQIIGNFANAPLVDAPGYFGRDATSIYNYEDDKFIEALKDALNKDSA
ncbi:MAG TPA: hypothetical protein VEP90_17865 [Methylomirabilota bacterium]|nr:hypothetical protein [Methylomirabilota bacterium]